MIHLPAPSSMLGANFIATIHNMRALHGLGPPAAVRVGRWPTCSYLPVLEVVDRRHGHDAAGSTATGAARSSIRRRAGRRCCGSTSSGSSGTPRSTSSSCRVPAGLQKSLPWCSPRYDLGYKAIAASTAAIAFPGWNRVGAPHSRRRRRPWCARLLQLSSFVIAVPTGVKIPNWSRRCGRMIEAEMPPLGGRPDRHLPDRRHLGDLPRHLIDRAHDTCSVVAHLHYVAIGGTMFGAMAVALSAIGSRRPRALLEGMGKVSFALVLVGFHVTFLVQHLAWTASAARLRGTPPRPAGRRLANQISTLGSFLLGIDDDLHRQRGAVGEVGTIAGSDPWKGNTSSGTCPPPPENVLDRSRAAFRGR